MIPEATAWFTGEALMEYEDDGEEEEGSEGDDAEEEDDSEVSECVCVQRGCGG